ncbi:restriction endonuclease [bacterium]|nr:restriction endonuclease [bacterium]
MDERGQILEWLRNACAEYRLEPRAVFRHSRSSAWPLTARNDQELEAKLGEGGHLLPLPKEPAALANVIEVTVVDYLLTRIREVPGALANRGTERGYPDIEIGGDVWGNRFHAVDVKVARRRNATRTQSRITLYTGNTYFRYDTLRWPGTFRPFGEYASHLDVIVLYTLDPELTQRARDVELLVHEAWRIGSRQRSSTTREYLGAVQSIDQLRAGKGEFASEREFYDYWRKYNFKTGRAVEKQLHRLLAQKDGATGRKPGEV